MGSRSKGGRPDPEPLGPPLKPLARAPPYREAPEPTAGPGTQLHAYTYVHMVHRISGRRATARAKCRIITLGCRKGESSLAGG